MNRKHSTTEEKPKYEPSYWQGSRKTAAMVMAQIAERWGEEEAEKYDPTANCFTFNTWRAKGFKVKKGEKALHSYTFTGGKATEEDGDEEQESAKYIKGVCLFYYLQVEKLQEKA